MKAKVWILSWLAIVITILGFCGYWVYRIDPYFHYHKPEIDTYFYSLNNQRSQNDGICKHFDYDAIITGTSMAENFKASEADSIFKCNSIKVPFSGATYNELNTNLKRALHVNPNIKIIIRGLDLGGFFDSADAMRNDLGSFPTYLYDDVAFNDLEYLLNRDIIFGRAYQMQIARGQEGFTPGITSFDEYSRWQDSFTFGIKSVAPDGILMNKTTEESHLTDEEKEVIRGNIEQNVTSLADEFTDVDFYYFYTPYSAAWWGNLYNMGLLYKQLEREQYITALIIPHKNIHLFSFNNRTDITTNLNNYKDLSHYGEWINSLMLKWMHDGKYQLTEENFEDYLKQEYDFYTSFDFSEMNDQPDYESDYYAAALLNNELTGARPINVLTNSDTDTILVGDKCVSARFSVDLDQGYNFLCFEGQKLTEIGSLTAVVRKDGNIVSKLELNASALDINIHQYVMDLSAFSGKVNIEFGGNINSTENDSDFQYSNIFMY